MGRGEQKDSVIAAKSNTQQVGRKSSELVLQFSFAAKH